MNNYCVLFSKHSVQSQINSFVKFHYSQNNYCFSRIKLLNKIEKIKRSEIHSLLKYSPICFHNSHSLFSKQFHTCNYFLMQKNPFPYIIRCSAFETSNNTPNDSKNNSKPTSKNNSKNNSKSNSKNIINNDSSPTVQIMVRAKPNASSNDVSIILEGNDSSKFENSFLLVSCTSTPKDNEANEAIQKLLSSFFGIGKTSLILVKGGTSRDKVFQIQGIPLQSVISKLKSSINQ